MVKYITDIEELVIDEGDATMFVLETDINDTMNCGVRAIVPRENTIYIPTIRLNVHTSARYFSDRPDEIKAVYDSLTKLVSAVENGVKLMIPRYGIGNELCDLKAYSPIIYKTIKNTLISIDPNYTKLEQSC